MKKTRKWLCGALALLATATCSFALSACEQNEPTQPNNPYPPSDSSELNPNELTGFEAPEARLVSYGEAVEISSPVVLDGYGNVLSVQFDVKDSKGASVKDFSRGFFAIDKAGYTVTYSVTLPDDSVKTVSTKIIVLDGFEKDDGFYLLKGTETKDLKEILPKNLPESVGVKYQVETRSDVNPDDLITNGVFDASKAGEGWYKITTILSATVDYPLHEITLDVQKSDIPVWSDMKDLEAYYTYSGYWTKTPNTITQLNGSELGMDGENNFWSTTVTCTDLPKSMYFTTAPMHSKGYYELYSDYAVNIVYRADHSTNPRDGYNVQVLRQGYESVINGGWHTSTVSFADIIETWGTGSNVNTLFYDDRLKDHADGGTFTLYVGGIEIVDQNSDNKQTAMEVQLLNSASATTDMTSLVDGSVKDELLENVENVTWRFVPQTGEAKPRIVNGMTANTSSMEYGMYTATARIGEKEVYSCSVDVFDEDDFDWVNYSNGYVNDSVISASNHWSDHLTYDGLATTEELQAIGTTVPMAKITLKSGMFEYESSPFKVKVRPLSHSKTYYEYYSDMVLTFDWYARAINKTADGVTVVSTAEDVTGMSVYGATAKNYAFNTVHTSLIPMSSLLAEWDDLTNSKNFSSFVGQSWLKFHATGDILDLAKSHVELYIGNIKVQPSFSSLGIVTEAPESAKLVEEATLTSEYDLTSLLSVAKNKGIVNEYAKQMTWTIVNGAGEETEVIGKNTVDTTSFARGVYTVTATLGDIAVYEGQLDVYDAETFEWFDATTVKAGTHSMTEKYGTHYDLGGVGVGSNAAAWKWGTVSVGTATADTNASLSTAGAKGTYAMVSFATDRTADSGYKYVGFKPIHSKAYYEQYAEKSFTFAFIAETGMEIPNSNGGYINNKVCSASKIEANTKYTGTVAISTILSDWEKVSVGKHYFFNSEWREVFANTFYFGEFTLVNK